MVHKPAFRPDWQQARFATDQYATFQAFNVEFHQGLPAGMRGGPADGGGGCGLEPAGQYGGQWCGLPEGGSSSSQATGDALFLEAAQDFQGAGCGLGVRGGGIGACPGTKVHQATTQAKQNSSQGGRVGDGYLGVRHVDIPEIAVTLSGQDDKQMTAG